METPTILITDAQSRQGLAAARSLGRAGLRIIVTDHERLTIAGCSRFTARSVVTPHPQHDEEAFIAAIQELIITERVRMILPMTDRSLLALARQREAFSSVILPFPQLSTIMVARDKSQTVALAKHIGVPVPETVVIQTLDDLQAVTWFPVFLKPVVSSGSRGATVVDVPDTLHHVTASILKEYGPVLAQSALPRDGAEIGCYVVCGPDSRPVASLLQRRERSFPITGGPATLRTTIHDERILQMSLDLLAHMHWQGPAMVEWKIDTRDDTPTLMEMNPRFWGSLESGIAAGVDFPLLTYKVFAGLDVGEPPRYTDAIQSRWLFPGDVLWLLRSGLSWRTLIAFFRAFGAHDDVWSWRDPLPFFGSFLIALLHLLQPSRRAFFLRR